MLRNDTVLAEAPQAVKRAAAERLGELLLHLLHGRPPGRLAREDFERRERVCTPFGGCYGVAGWVLAVNGSPPRGALVVMGDVLFTAPATVFYLGQGRSRRLAGEGQVRAVREFFRLWLDGRREAFTVAGQGWDNGRQGEPGS
jgi:hypothetical protein